MHAGQVHCDEDTRGGDLLAGQVAPDYANRLMLFDIALVEYLHGKKSNYTLGCALLFSRAWIVLLEHARDRGRSAGDGPILEHAQDSQHVVINICTT